MNLITENEFHNYLNNSTRSITCSDGVTRDVTMSPSMWDHFEFVVEFEDVSAEDISRFAMEEVELQGLDFNSAFKSIVAYLTNLWSEN